MTMNVGSRVRHIAQQNERKTAEEIQNDVDYGTGTVADISDDGSYIVRWDDTPSDYTGELCSYDGSDLLIATRRPAKLRRS